jgi:AbrB family looped-hinge helix DNA binding protein
MDRLLFSEDIAMTLMRVRRAAQLTLPADVRQALNVKEGDYLEAHITKDGVLLTPVQVVERKRAWKSIEEIASRVRDLEPDPNDRRLPRSGLPRRLKTSAINMPKAVFDTTILVSALLNFVIPEARRTTSSFLLRKENSNSIFPMIFSKKPPVCS